ncbi:MAG: dimethyl sulfoxide reductase anchor subunit [Burkholderiales bacterium]|nr:dimethyl sulfoxide reductase anchor subunit [Burkholderiales bacterium]
MTYPAKGYGNYGPVPWHQGSWDIRAAGNFIGGGMGSGLIVFAAISGAAGVVGAGLFLAGLALVGFGLFCVSLELGRPLRALNVFRNPRTSWMAREAWTAVLLVPAALAAAAGVAGAGWIAALLALAFLWCQASLLQAARGIPAWREPLLRPLLLTTGLVEGAGLLLIATLGPVNVAAPLAIVAGALLVVRWWLWRAYRLRLAGTAAPQALAALDAAGKVLLVAGTIVPLALIGAAGVAGGAAAPIAALAGLGMVAAGVYAKLVLVTRAGFNQGFALPQLPVRGTRA